MEFLELPLQDAAMNLSLEESLFTTLPRSHPGYFLLWQNRPSVIIGRNQILQETVEMGYVRAKKIPVIRRITGGGAVYHDAGNLNFSFIENVSSGQKAEFASYLASIAAALRKLGFPVRLNGRNDLEVGGRKFSGNSQLRRDGKILHHGTLLINVDLERMSKILTVDESKFKSKGVPSLRARVINLAELRAIDLKDLKAALASACTSSAGTIPDFVCQRAMQLARKKYDSDEWNYGKSPACALEKRRRFSWGELIVQLGMKGGRITSCSFRGDIINLRDLDELEKKFEHLLFEPGEMSAICGEICWEEYIASCESSEICRFLCKELFE